jgi:hypothetical protein
MFSFLNRSRPRYPSIRQALVQSGVSTAANPVMVAVLETHGLFSGRRVNFFRALDGHKDLLGSGHVEHGGMVVVNSRPAPGHAATPAREPADRAAHADDERLVFWDAEAARSSEGSLSAPAVTWLQARSTPSLSMK